MFGRNDTVQRARKKGEVMVREFVRERLPQADVFSFGAIDISPSYLAIWVTTGTDEERDALRNDETLVPRLRELLVSAGYPQDHVPSVGFEFESQETVDRDFGGSWRYTVK